MVTDFKLTVPSWLTTSTVSVMTPNGRAKPTSVTVPGRTRSISRIVWNPDFAAEIT